MRRTPEITQVNSGCGKGVLTKEQMKEKTAVLKMSELTSREILWYENHLSGLRVTWFIPITLV